MENMWIFSKKRKKTGHELSEEDRLQSIESRRQISELRRMDFEIKKAELELKLLEIKDMMGGEEEDPIEAIFTGQMKQVLATKMQQPQIQTNVPVQQNQNSISDVQIEQMWLSLPEQIRERAIKLDRISLFGTVQRYVPGLSDLDKNRIVNYIESKKGATS